MTITNCPPEVIDEVIDWFDPVVDFKTLRRCASTSLSLRVPARRRIFSHIRLRPLEHLRLRGSRIRTRAQTFYDLITEFPDIATLVRSCRIEEEYSVFLTDEKLFLVLDSLTNLQSLCISAALPFSNNLRMWEDIPLGKRQVLQRVFRRLVRLELWTFSIRLEDFPALFGPCHSIRELKVSCRGKRFQVKTLLANCPQLTHLNLEYSPVTSLGEIAPYFRNGALSLDIGHRLRSLALKTEQNDEWDLRNMASLVNLDTLEQLTLQIDCESVKKSQRPDFLIFSYLRSLTMIARVVMKLEPTLQVLGQLLECIPPENKLQNVAVEIRLQSIAPLSPNFFLDRSWTRIDSLFISSPNLNKVNRFAIEIALADLNHRDIADIYNAAERYLPEIYDRGIFRLALTPISRLWHTWGNNYYKYGASPATHPGVELYGYGLERGPIST